MGRSVEEWGALLQQHIAVAARIEREELPELKLRYEDWAKEYAELRKLHSALRITAKNLKRRQLDLGKRFGRISLTIHKLRENLHYGNALLASHQDIEAFEKAVKRRRTRLRVAKLRKKQKAKQITLAEELPILTGLPPIV